MKDKITSFLEPFTPCEMGEFFSYKKSNDDDSLGEIDEALRNWFTSQAIDAKVCLIKVLTKSDYDLYALSISYVENGEIVLLSYPVFSY